MTLTYICNMATKKEIDLLWKLLDATSQEKTVKDAYGRDENAMHPRQENGTYTDGVVDCIKLLLKKKTITEILNS